MKQLIHGRKMEGILVGIFLLFCGVCFVLFFPKETDRPIAVVTCDGAEVLRIDLSESPDQTIALNDKPVSFQISDHQIRFVHVDCPDHICQQSGYLSKAGQMAVCMPNRVALTIYDQQELS